MNAKEEDRHPHRRSIPPGKRNKKIEGRVYIVHLDEPVGKSQHYTGSTKSPKTAEERLADHKEGKPGSSALLREANRRGTDYHIVRDWPGNVHVENQLKLGSAKVYCPECTENPRVPKIVQQAIKREQREIRRAARHKELMEKVAAMPPRAAATISQKFGRGARAGHVWAMAQINSGKSPEEIEEVAERVTAPHYDEHRKPAQEVEQRGWQMQLDSDLALLRDLQREDERQQGQQEMELEAG